MKTLIQIIQNIFEKKISDKNREQVIDNIDSYLDTMGTDTFDDTAFDRLIKPNGPCIYAFYTEKFKDAIKIGYSDY